MEYQVIVDTDHIIDISKNISSTSKEIANSINSLEKVCNDLGYNVLDKNMNDFKNNFSSYLISLKELIVFYDNMTSTLNDLVREYDSLDEENSSDLKKTIISDEEGVE